jgi:hypothetical protein
VDSSVEYDGGAFFGKPQERMSGVRTPDRQDQDVPGKAAPKVRRVIDHAMNRGAVTPVEGPRANDEPRERSVVNATRAARSQRLVTSTGRLPHRHHQHERASERESGERDPPRVIGLAGSEALGSPAPESFVGPVEGRGEVRLALATPDERP